MLAHIGKSHKVDMHQGRKLDSINLLEYTTIRQVLDDELNDIIDGSLKLEEIPCHLDVPKPAPVTTSPEQSAEPPTSMPSKIIKLPTRLPIKIPAKLSTKLPGKAHGAKGQPLANGEDEDETDEPFDYLLPYPTIVCRPDRVWVELRCDVCGVSSSIPCAASLILMLQRATLSRIVTNDMHTVSSDSTDISLVGMVKSLHIPKHVCGSKRSLSVARIVKFQRMR